MAPGKGVEKQVMALARAQHLGQQGVGRGQSRPAGLQRQHGARGLQLGRAPVAGLCAGQLGHHGVGERGGQRHLAPVPARHGGLAAAGAPHPGRHLMDAHQLQLPPAEQETVAGLEPRHKTLFHMADLAAAQVLHHHASVAHDGANVHAVAPRQPRVGHAPHAVFVGHHAAVVGVRGQRGAALAHKVQTPLPSVVGQVGVSGGAADFGQQCVGHKATAQGHCHQVLHQHIERLLWRVARFDVARLHRRARRHAFDDFQAVGRHDAHPRWPARTVARAAGALQQPRHAFGRSDLQHPFHRRKVHAQVQAAGAHHRAQGTVLQAGFHPLAHRAVERAVVQCDLPGPVGPRVQQRLVPQLGLRAGVGEHQGAATGVDLSHHRGQHGQTQVPGPGETLHLGR